MKLNKYEPYVRLCKTGMDPQQLIVKVAVLVSSGEKLTFHSIKGTFHQNVYFEVKSGGQSEDHWEHAESEPIDWGNEPENLFVTTYIIHSEDKKKLVNSSDRAEPYS